MTNDEFLKYCFSRPIQNGDEWFWHEDVYSPEPETLFHHLNFTFKSSAKIVEQYLPDQIGLGMKFIFGIGSQYFETLYNSNNSSLPIWIDEIRFSMKFVYDEIFEPLADRKLSHLIKEASETSILNQTLYMLGDCDSFEIPIWRDAKSEISDNLISIFEYGLIKSNIAIIESSIHALSHASLVCPRAKTILDKLYISSPVELVSYLERARNDEIQ